MNAQINELVSFSQKGDNRSQKNTNKEKTSFLGWFALHFHSFKIQPEVPETFFESNTKLAHKIMKYVHNTVSVVRSNEPATFLDFKKSADVSRVREITKITLQNGVDNPFEQMQVRSRLASEAHAGNCAEMADIGLAYCLSKGIYDRLIDEVTIKNGDHDFLVIGRDPESDLHDYRTWGRDAVVCDIWAKKIYPVSAIEENLYDLEFSRYSFTFHLRKFNPKSQTLRIPASNMMTCKDFEKKIRRHEPSQGYPRSHLGIEPEDLKLEIGQALHNLYSASSIEEKREVAKNLISRPWVNSLRKKPWKKFLLQPERMASVVVSQMNSFLQQQNE